jgi:hypothetical protein
MSTPRFITLPRFPINPNNPIIWCGKELSITTFLTTLLLPSNVPSNGNGDGLAARFLNHHPFDMATA